MSALKSAILAMVYGLFLFAASTEVVWAHDPGLSSALINVHHGKVEVVLTFARRDAEQLLRQFDEADASSAPERSGRLGQNSLARLVCDGFRIAFDHRAGAVKGLTTRDDDPNNTSIAWTLVCDQFLSLQVASELLQHLPRGHRQYLAIQVESSKPIAERLLSAQENAVEIVIPPSVAGDVARRSAAGFVKLGVRHILTGYDHLLFLFGLLIATRQFAPALRIITCFTIAHSITLAIATLSSVPAPPSLVEPLIAASIVYVGLENLARGDEPKGRWLLTFVFGLVHGCGFASALRDMGIGTGGDGIALPLICFNGGVELGQLLIAAVLLPIIWHLKAKPVFLKRFVPVSSMAVVILGGYWLVQRMLLN